MLAAIWPRLKVWRKVPLGPVQLAFNFQRRVRLRRQDKASAVLAALQFETLAPAPLQAAPSAHTAPVPALLPALPPQQGTAVLVGVGPGFGHAMARHLAASGFDLVLVSRNAAALSPLIESLRSTGQRIQAFAADITQETDVAALFESVAASCGSPSLVVYGLQEFGPGQVLDVTVPAFESAWRHNCLGPFMVSRAAGRLMRNAGRGSIFLVGSTSSVIGRAGHLTLATGKFGQRALAQVLARELWPAGIHVAHLMIDADICESGECGQGHPQADPTHLAQAILAIHQQPMTAWCSEMDLRPWNENFWEHC